jgi:hypothetical protein
MGQTVLRAVLLFSVFSVHGCASWVEPGVSVELVSGPVSFDGQTFAAAEGARVRLDSAFWTNTTLELAACEGLGARALDLLIPTAHAHGIAAPTRSASPVVQSSFTPRASVLGTLTPPAADYCSLLYGLGPADFDAVGIPAAPQMLGLSLRVRGAFETGDGRWREFEVVSLDEVQARRTDFVLELNEPGRRVTLRIEHDVSAWFEGVDFREVTPPRAREARLLDNIANSIRIHVD